MQHFYYIMDFSLPLETQRAWRRFCLFHFYLFSKELFHRGMHKLELSGLELVDPSTYLRVDAEETRSIERSAGARD
jgi:hypothetical protein